MLARGVIHNFNNLLAAVLGQTSLARAKLAAESPALVHLDKAVVACTRAAELTRQMLAYSSKGADLSNLFSLNVLLYEALALVHPLLSDSPQWRLELDSRLSLLEGDADQLRRMLVDLLLNAAKAAGGPAGVVTVRSGVMQVDAGTVIQITEGGSLTPGVYAFLAVQDNGTGMDAELLERILDPYICAKDAAGGLSFSANWRVEQQQRGGVTVESGRDHGSMFCMFLPFSDPENRVQPLGSSAPAMETHKDTVLVVDDEPSVREVLAEAVETAGLHALTAEDGRQGLETFRNHQRAIALIVLDMQMPVMNGAETAKELWKLEPSLPLILTSGFFEQRLVDDLVRHPAAVFLPKPYTIDTFLTMLHGRLQSGSEQPV
jgi:CheY-like chemotaxis protein